MTIIKNLTGKEITIWPNCDDPRVGTLPGDIKPAVYVYPPSPEGHLCFSESSLEFWYRNARSIPEHGSTLVESDAGDIVEECGVLYIVPEIVARCMALDPDHPRHDFLYVDGAVRYGDDGIAYKRLVRPARPGGTAANALSG